MPIGLETTLRSARIQLIVDRLDAAVTPGKLLLYTEPRPATGAAITTQTLLGTVGFADPSGAVVDGILTFSTFTEDPLADNTGLIAWARGLDGDNNFVLDLGCGVSGGGQEVIFNTLSVQAGGVIQILSGALTEGNA